MQHCRLVCMTPYFRRHIRPMAINCRRRVLIFVTVLLCTFALRHWEFLGSTRDILEEVSKHSSSHLRHVPTIVTDRRSKKILTIVFYMNVLPVNDGGRLNEFDSITNFFLGKIDRPVRVIAAKEFSRRPRNDSLHVYLFRPEPGTLFANLKAEGFVNQGAYHIGDGRFIYDVSCYSQATYVFRNHYNAEYFSRFPNAHFAPLGMKSGFGFLPPTTLLPASQRRLVANFVGTLNLGNRAHMVEKMRLRRIPVYFSIDHEWGSKDALHIIDYRNILRESVFTLAPYGYHTESMRLYEALEAGSIPLFQRYNTSRSPMTPMGPNVPVPQFETWDEGADFIARMNSDPQALDDLQRRCMEFWKWYKEDIQKRFKSVIDSAFEAAHGYKC